MPENMTQFISVSVAVIAAIGLITAFVIRFYNAKQTKLGRDEILAFCDKTFGKKAYKVYKSQLDYNGNLHYFVYTAKYEWFKAPVFNCFSVYKENSTYAFDEIPN